MSEIGKRLAEERIELAFLPPILCQLSLPRSRQEDGEFIRKSGDAWIVLQSGYLDLGNGPERQPLPFGPMSRLILAYLCSYAIRFKTQEIPIGKNPSQFLRLIGIKGKDGRRFAKLYEQIKYFSACHLQYGRGGITHNPAPPVKTFINFGNWKEWPGKVILSDEFYQSLQKSAVPLNLEVLLSLSGSALAMDVYIWLCHRLCQIQGNRPVILRWKNLMDQFGQEYRGKEPTKDFKKKFLMALHKVKGVYPSARVEPVRRPPCFQ